MEVDDLYRNEKHRPACSQCQGYVGRTFRRHFRVCDNCGSRYWWLKPMSIEEIREKIFPLVRSGERLPIRIPEYLRRRTVLGDL